MGMALHSLHILLFLTVVTVLVASDPVLQPTCHDYTHDDCDSKADNIVQELRVNDVHKCQEMCNVIYAEKCKIFQFSLSTKVSHLKIFIKSTYL